MGWLIIVGLAAVTFFGLWYFGTRDKGVAQFLGAALLVALAGYAWQGRPALRGSPKAPPERQQLPDSEFAQTREDLMGRFDRAWYWLNISDGFARRGDTFGAAEVIEAGLRSNPRDPDLWAGLGSALVAHANGLMTPAADLAFARATELAPEHPAPRFYRGLALAQGGQLDEAERIWRQLLSEAAPEASYRQTIERQLQALQQARAMGQAPQPPAPAAPQPQSPPRTR